MDIKTDLKTTIIIIKKTKIDEKQPQKQKER